MCGLLRCLSLINLDSMPYLCLPMYVGSPTLRSYVSFDVKLVKDMAFYSKQKLKEEKKPQWVNCTDNKYKLGVVQGDCLLFFFFLQTKKGSFVSLSKYSFSLLFPWQFTSGHQIIMDSDTSSWSAWTIANYVLVTWYCFMFGLSLFGQYIG